MSRALETHEKDVRTRIRRLCNTWSYKDIAMVVKLHLYMPVIILTATYMCKTMGKGSHHHQCLGWGIHCACQCGNELGARRRQRKQGMSKKTWRHTFQEDLKVLCQLAQGKQSCS